VKLQKNRTSYLSTNMKRQQYYSDPTLKTKQTKLWADENFNFFSGLISHYQFARGSCNTGNTKAIIAAALNKKASLNKSLPLNCSKAEWTRHFAGWTKIKDAESGEQVQCQILREWQFQEAITKKSKLYYCSGSNRIGMPYGDIDCHHAWQTPEMAQQAQQIFQLFFPSLGMASDRGANNWIKVDRGSYSCEKANLILLGDKEQNILGLEGAMQRVLAVANCFADFEIKGTFAYLDNGQWQWGKYGKLPIHRPEWDRQKLQELVDQPVIHIQEIEEFIRQVEQDIPQSVLDEMNAEKARRNGEEPLLVDEEMLARIKRNWGDRWHEAMHERIQDEDGNCWIEHQYLKPPSVITTEVKTPVENIPPIQPVITNRKPLDVRVNNVDLQDEVDAFRRQRLALMRVSRALGRVPNMEEALNYIREQNLYSGSWEGNRDRTKRVKDILKRLRRTFDPSKIKKGSVQVGKHKKYVSRKFPNGIKWGRERRWLDDECNVRSRIQWTYAPTDFVAVFLDIVDFCLNDQPNENGHVPTNRCKRLWNKLFAKEVISVRWCPRKFAACREYLSQRGLFKITDRNFAPGKAMTWEIGQFFPGSETWKRTKVRKVGGQSMTGLASANKKEYEKEKEYNTLLHINYSPMSMPVHYEPPRRPP